VVHLQKEARTVARLIHAGTSAGRTSPGRPPARRSCWTPKNRPLSKFSCRKKANHYGLFRSGLNDSNAPQIPLSHLHQPPSVREQQPQNNASLRSEYRSMRSRYLGEYRYHLPLDNVLIRDEFIFCQVNQYISQATGQFQPVVQDMAHFRTVTFDLTTGNVEFSQIGDRLGA